MVFDEGVVGGEIDLIVILQHLLCEGMRMLYIAFTCIGMIWLGKRRVDWFGASFERCFGGTIRRGGKRLALSFVRVTSFDWSSSQYTSLRTSLPLRLCCVEDPLGLYLGHFI